MIYFEYMGEIENRLIAICAKCANYYTYDDHHLKFTGLEILFIERPMKTINYNAKRM